MRSVTRVYITSPCSSSTEKAIPVEGHMALSARSEYLQNLSFASCTISLLLATQNLLLPPPNPCLFPRPERFHSKNVSSGKLYFPWESKVKSRSEIDS